MLYFSVSLEGGRTFSRKHMVGKKSYIKCLKIIHNRSTKELTHNNNYNIKKNYTKMKSIICKWSDIRYDLRRLLLYFGLKVIAPSTKEHRYVVSDLITSISIAVW
jgi:hypothetical protein